MKSSDLKEGRKYDIRYIENKPTYYRGRINRRGPLKNGVGTLVSMHKPYSSWHTFTLGNGSVVYASSNGVKSEYMMGQTVDLVDPEVKQQAEKLRNLGAPDDQRETELAAVATFLEGLDIKAEPDDAYTYLKIPYASVASLRALVGHLYGKTLLDDI